MAGQWIESYVPARLDRLPWGRHHWLIVIALGATWILDGLEVTLAGSVGAILTHRATLHLSDAQVGATATFYLIGAVVGALVFGYATDRLGRKRLFFVTVAVYLVATAATATSWNFASYAFFRALTGAGIGGEYAAINSAIDELIPARVRGRVRSHDQRLLLDRRGSGGGRDPLAARSALSAGVVRLAFRLWDRRRARLARDVFPPVDPGKSALAHDSRPRKRSGADCRRDGKQGRCPDSSADTTNHRRAFALAPIPPGARFGMRSCTNIDAAQSSVSSSCLRRLSSTTRSFSTYPLVLMRFYDVPAEKAGLYLLPFALGNVLGPLVIGHLFDTIGRKPMITATYIISGPLLAADWLAFSRRTVDRANADDRLDGNLLCRLGCGQLGLSDGE